MSQQMTSYGVCRTWHCLLGKMIIESRDTDKLKIAFPPIKLCHGGNSVMLPYIKASKLVQKEFII